MMLVLGLEPSHLRNGRVTPVRRDNDVGAYFEGLAAASLGHDEWSGVCATCHGNLGQGGYGPSIASNPTITQPAALEGIIRNGVTGTQGAMPPVADTWNRVQIKALEDYLQQHIYKAGPVGG